LPFDPLISKATQFASQTHFGCELSLDGEPDFDKKNKINRSRRIGGTIRKRLKNPYRQPNDQHYSTVAKHG